MAEKSVKTENPSIVPPKVRTRPAAPARPSSAKPGQAAGFAAGFMTCLLVFILSLGALAAAFYFNLGDIKTTIVAALRLSETEFRYLETRHSLLAETESELASQNQKLAADQMAIDQKSNEISAAEALLATRASELDTLASQLSDEKASLDSVIGIYEAMEPQKAAAILTVPADLTDNILILKNMNKSKLALILAEMTPDQAAEILARVAGN